MATLNPRQLKFIDLYLATGNATQSYVDAYGQNDRRAAEAGASRLLSSGKVKEAVSAARKQVLEKFPLTYEAVLHNMWEQARYYEQGASHMARVRATELVMQHFRPPEPPPQSGGVTVNVATLSADELRRRIEEIKSRIASVGGVGSGTGTAGVPHLVAEAHPGVQLDVAPPPADSNGTPENH